MAEIDEIYKRIAKLAHPDVGLGMQSDERNRLMQLANSAYKRRDVEALHSIDLALQISQNNHQYQAEEDDEFEYQDDGAWEVIQGLVPDDDLDECWAVCQFGHSPVKLMLKWWRDKWGNALPMEPYNYEEMNDYVRKWDAVDCEMRMNYLVVWFGIVDTQLIIRSVYRKPT